MVRKRINAPIYTRGRYGRGWWDTVDTDSDYLYSWCRYPTKITEADLPEDYIKIRSRVTRYMTGYLKTSGIVDMAYRPVKFNHMFKDDYLYISYEEPLRLEKSGLGFEDCVNYDICVCGNDIVDVVLAAERHSGTSSRSKRRKGQPPSRQRFLWGLRIRHAGAVTALTVFQVGRGVPGMDAILCETDVAERICIAQAKEKFGTLRFCIEKTWPDLDECDDTLEARVDKAMRELGRVIERMTEETAKVCVFCGTSEDVHLRQGWVHYSCGECEGQR